MPNSLLLAAALSASLVTFVNAWGRDVHCQIGFMAEEMINSKTKSLIGQILEPEYNGSIGRAGGWADSFGYNGGEYSQVWHYLDAADNPPAYCNAYYYRDCSAEGCVVRAIANQTQILESCIQVAKAGDIPDDSKTLCAQALKWVVHFIGDIAQPLHVSNRAVGGNEVNVTYNGRETNLHSVWDSQLALTAAQVSHISNQTIEPYFHHLVDRVKADNFPESARSWVENQDPAQPIQTAMRWAQESNALTCDYVYSQNYQGVDLAESGYAANAIPIIDMQISKAAYRLAKWLDTLTSDDYRNDRILDLKEVPAWTGQ